MNRLALIATCTALAFTTQVQAADHSPAYTQCMDKASSTQAMSACIQTETAIQDKQLNRVYKQLMAKLPVKRQKQLKDVQRSWIAFRDKNCAFYVQPDGGTLAPIEGGMCVMNMTRDRASELQRVLSPEA